MATKKEIYEEEVLLHIWDCEKYPITENLYKTGFLKGFPKRYVRHTNAFKRLTEKGLTYLNKKRIWSLTNKGYNFTKKLI